MRFLILLLITFHGLFVSADTLTELELYQASTVGPIHTDLNTDDIEVVSDDGIVAYIIEKPSMENLFVSPPPVLITFPLSGEQLNRLELAWIKRAIREGKEAMYYVNKARASEEDQRALVKSSARLAFEIYPDSNLFSQFSDHLTCEQHYYHCQLENSILKAEVIKLNNIIASMKRSSCDDLGWGNGNVYKPTSDGYKGQGVIVMEARYCNGQGGPSVSDFRMEDSLGNEVANPYFRECNGDNQGRLHVGFSPEGKNISGPVFVRYNYKGVEECRKVSNPTNRED